MPIFSSRSPAVVVGWTLLCVFWSWVGWILSAFHQLKPAGYLVSLALALAISFFVFKRMAPPRWTGVKPAKLRRRFSRLYPLGFLTVALLAVLGGVLHAPNNYDALAYRTPRVLHWLAEGRWHWIHTEFNRLNTRGCAMEWLTAPLIALTRTDRLLFVINVCCYLLLPGRVFSLLAGLGVSRRMAWRWMWILPTGYCYVLQAGSIGNDLLGAFFAMTAIEFALRARHTGRVDQLWISVLAAALMTAGKAFNLLLLLPWAVAVLPSVPLLWRRPAGSTAIAVLVCGASLLPTLIFNRIYCGDWTGMKAEQGVAIATGAPAFHIAVNSVLLVLHNFVPTVFPVANRWNQWMDHLIPGSMAARLQAYFEPAGAHLHLGEMQMEESAGLGFGVSVLMLILLGCALFRKKKGPVLRPKTRWLSYEMLIAFAAWVACAIFMAQSGLSCPARYLAPFYALLLAPFIIGASFGDGPGGKLFWKSAGVGVFGLAALLVVITPSRPLWPAMSVLRALGADRSSHPLVRRAWTVYHVYGQRADAFAPARAILPPHADPLGLVTFDDPETSLWRPFGSRRIRHVCRDDTSEALSRLGINYLLASSTVVTQHYQMSFDQWQQRQNAESVARLTLELRAGRGPTDWFLVKRR